MRKTAANVEMQGIEFQIVNDSTEAAKGLDELAKSLANLKSNIGKSDDRLSGVAKGIRELKNALNDVKLSSFTKNIKNVADGLKPLSEMKFNGITKFIGEVNKLNGSKLLLISQIDFSNLKEAADNAKTISGVSRISTAVKATTNEIPTSEIADVTVPASVGEMSEALGEVKRKADEATSSIKKTTSAAKENSKAMKEAATSSKGFGSRLKDLVKSFARIVKYRAIRTIIAGITSSVKEGVQNLAQYSAALNGTDSSGLNNTLSQYAAKLLELKNAIGAAVAPMLQAMLPAFNTIAELAVNAANAINQFFSAMNGQTTYTKAIYNAVDYADSLNGAADAANNLKKSVMGFDELNILPDNSGVATGDYGISYEDMFKEEEIGSGMQEFGKWAKDNLDEIITLIGSVWLAIKAVKVISWATNVMKKLKALKILDKVKDLKTNLTGVQKGAIVAVAAVAEFATIKSAVKSLASGCEDVGTKIAEIGVAATAAGAVMYAVMGPYGIALAAVTGLAAAIIGVKEAQMEMMETMADEAFYSGTGTKISTLAENYDLLMDSVTNAYEPLLESKDRLDAIKDSAGIAAENILGISTSIEKGVSSATESLPEIESQFEEFSLNVQSAMDEIYNSVITALSGSFGAALLANGASMGEILTTMNAMKKSGDETFAGLMGDYSKLTEKLEAGDITDTEFAKSLSDITQKMSGLIGVSTEAGDVFEDLKDSIGNIDWEDDTAVSDFFSSVTASTKEAKDSITASYDYLIDNLKTIRDSWNLSPELKAVADEWIATAKSDKNAQLAAIDSQLTELFDGVQADVILKMQDLESSLKKEWGEMNWFKKLYWDNEADYVESGLSKYKNKYVSDIAERVDKSFKQLGIDGSAWATDAVDRILDAAFDYSMAYSKWSFGDDLSGAIESEFEKIGVSGAKNAAEAGKEIGDSLASSIYNQTQENLRSLIPNYDLIDSILNPKPKIPGINGYATGGFPTVGDLFIANEAGAEMVGSIGGRTAVANNDQIETALENAMYRGVRAAMSEGGSSNGGGQTRVIIATVDGRVLYETIVDEARSDTMRTGYNRLVEV